MPTLNERFANMMTAKRPSPAPRTRAVSVVPQPRQTVERKLRREKAKAARPQAPRPQRPRSLYRAALLDPIGGPMVGVPTTVPVQTFVTRVKASATITVTTGALALCCQPTYMLSKNGPGRTDGASEVATSNVGGFSGELAASFGTGTVGLAGFSNAPYSASDFIRVAAVGASSVRGRVVSCLFRICNTSAANTRNGTFTTYVDPAHNTLQGVTAATAASSNGGVRYPASTTDWHSILYHPVDPDEVEGWVVDPKVGPAFGVKHGSYVTGSGATVDGGTGDNFPGYMGIWWNGDSTVPQTFLVEAYAIVEYIGSAVQPMLRDNPAADEVAHHAHGFLDKVKSFVAPSNATGSGHPMREFASGAFEAGKDALKARVMREGGKAASKYAFEALMLA